MAALVGSAGTPPPGSSVEPGGPRPTGVTQKPRRVRRWAVIGTVVVVVLSVVFAAVYLETQASGPTDVLVNGANLGFNYTNVPAGKTATNVFEYAGAWFNATGESPSGWTIQAPAGSAVRLGLTIYEDLFPPGVPVNCSVNGIVALSPFAIVSLEAQFKSGVWSAHPFPLNFSGENYLSNPPASVMLNVTLPSQNGVYTPTFVFDITCEQYP